MFSLDLSICLLTVYLLDSSEFSFCGRELFLMFSGIKLLHWRSLTDINKPSGVICVLSSLSPMLGYCTYPPGRDIFMLL